MVSRYYSYVQYYIALFNIPICFRQTFVQVASHGSLLSFFTSMLTLVPKFISIGRFAAVLVRLLLPNSNETARDDILWATADYS